MVAFHQVFMFERHVYSISVFKDGNKNNFVLCNPVTIIYTVLVLVLVLEGYVLLPVLVFEPLILVLVHSRNKFIWLV